MAEKRMFAKSIVLSDAFLDMPMSARCLYFTLGMNADDDGIVGNPKSVMRQCGASVDDLNVLISKRYVLSFESGVIAIKHWKINNYIQKDRYKQSTYIEELSTLSLDEKGSYTECIQPVYKMDTQNRLDKIRLDKISIEQTNKKTTVCDLLTEEEFWKLDSIYEDFLDLIDLVDKIYCNRLNEIHNAYNLIVTIAERNGWVEK